MKRTIALVTTLVVASLAQSNATETVRELWDNVPAGSLQGTTNGTTSFGFYPSAAAVWNVNPNYLAATNVLQVQDYGAEDFEVGVYVMLPASETTPESLAIPTGNTNGWNSGSWATRLLNTSSWIHFNSVSTNYFSARMIKRGLWYYNTNSSPETNNYGPDDAALGLGFANGNASSSYFVGAGFTRTVAYNGGGGYTNGSGTDIGDSDYISVGTLGQAGYASHPTDSGGPYYVSAYGPPQEVEGYIGGYPDIANAYVNGGLLIGRIITSASGASEEDVLTITTGGTIPTADNVSQIPAWDATYFFTNTATLDYLLVWMYGNNNGNPCYLDGIRVATTLQEAVGEEIVGAPTITTIGPPPVVTNTVYAGTPIVLSTFANINGQDPSSSYEWLANSNPIAGASGPGNVNYVYTNFDPTIGPNNYSVVFSNYYGLSLTSQVQTLTVLPAGPPLITLQPVGVTRYAGAPGLSLIVAVVGTPPFSYQWAQVVGNTTNYPATQTNQIFSLTDIQTNDAGSYFCTITNALGSTNSATAVVSVIVPTGYAAAVVANNPYAYWTLGETNGNVVTNLSLLTTAITNGIATGTLTTSLGFEWLHDYWNGNDGAVLDPTNVTLGKAGAVDVGFPANHNAAYIANNSYYSRVNMPALTNYEPTMTLVCWLYLGSAPAANGFIFNRDLNSGGGYGNAYGFEFVEDTNANPFQLGYQWAGYTWANSGVYVPVLTWTFVALVISNNQATIYMGTNDAPLTVATATLPSNLDTNYPGGSYTNSFPLMLDRGGWPWADQSGPLPGTNAWSGAAATMSDVAIYTNALPPANVYKLYLAAVGELITYTNPSGSLTLYWPEGTLQSATNVNGTYTPVSGSPTSPYTVPNPKTPPRLFYRVQQ
jgi:hypothetical protein